MIFTSNKSTVFEFVFHFMLRFFFQIMSDEQIFSQLKSFSINDLQSLLTFAGQSRTGKRYDLVENCFKLIKSSKTLRDKFDELANKRFGQGDLPTIPYPKDLKKNTHQQQLNIDIRFFPLTFNEDLCLISPPFPIPSIKQLPNGTQSLANFYFLLTAQQASGEKGKLNCCCCRSKIQSI